MKKRGIILLLVSFKIMSIFMFYLSVPIEATTKVDTVTIHYQRTENDYEGWNLWVWPEKKEGAEYQFSGKDEFGSFIELDVSQWDVLKIGFILKKTVADNPWAEKDYGEDRYITLSNPGPDGIQHVYLRQGDGIVYDNPDFVSHDLAIQYASFIDEQNIEVKTNNQFVQPLVTVRENAQQIAAHITQSDTNKLIIQLMEEIKDVKKQYYLTIQDGEKIADNIPVRYFKFFSTASFEQKYVPEKGKYQFGVSVDEAKTTFHVWSPTATQLSVNLYETSNTKTVQKLPLSEKENGVWSYEYPKNLEGYYYTYTVTNYGITSEVMDPYAISATTNGNKALITDIYNYLATDNRKDQYVETKQEDAIIYEAHVRDLTMSPTTNHDDKLRGKFLGVAQKGTTNADGNPTGFDHIRSLGVTHVHFLPVFDFKSVDESRLDIPQFNWGYDPQNYNVVEGSYSTDPEDGYVRMKEFKSMVSTFHQEHIGVIMDVVYNHTGKVKDNQFELLVPDYYFRQSNDGNMANGSGTGNETASEHEMFRRYMVDSLKMWTKAYKIDGFRFDLMAIHDIETMNLIAQELRAINPNIVLYGEGWHAGGSPLDPQQAALKKNAHLLDDIAVFDDDLRDGIKGSVFDGTDSGFVNGNQKSKDAVVFGMQGAAVPYGDLVPYTTNSKQKVSYVTAHDNYTLFDKLLLTNPDATIEQREKMQIISNALVLTSEGVPFLHSGVEMMRTKNGNHNSYNAPDEVNQLDYQRLSEYQEVYQHYRSLIQLRKEHPLFKQITLENITANRQLLQATQNGGAQEIAFHIKDGTAQDTWSDVVLFFNMSDVPVTYEVPEKKWVPFVTHQVMSNPHMKIAPRSSEHKNEVTVSPYSMMVAYVEKTSPDINTENNQIPEHVNVGYNHQAGNLGNAHALVETGYYHHEYFIAGFSIALGSISLIVRKMTLKRRH